jgi:hypothetical protein
MKRLHVKVTKEDIENGTPWMSMQCPIALAVKREYPKAKVLIAPGTIIFDNRWYIPNFIRKRLPEQLYKTPAVAREFIHNFDNNLGEVYPIEFEAQEWK